MHGLSAQTYVLDEQQHSPIEDVRVAYGKNELVFYTNDNGEMDSSTTGCFSLFHPAYYTRVACNTDTVYLLKKTELIGEVNVTNKTICNWAIPEGKKNARMTIGSQSGDMGKVME